MTFLSKLGIKVGAVIFMASTLLVQSWFADSLHAKQTQPPTATTPTTEQQYMAQIDKANVALDNYMNLPCDSDPTVVATALNAETDNLEEAYSNLPSGQDSLVQNREDELYVGFVEVANSRVSLKLKTCAPPPPVDDKHTVNS